MKRFTSILFMGILVLGCAQKHDPRISLNSEVASNNLFDNIVTRPVTWAFNGLFGDDIQIDQAVTYRDHAGFLQLHVKGFNRSYRTRQFQYKVQWFDENQCLVHDRTDIWLVATVKGKSGFRINLASPSAGAVDFKMETKKAELIKAKVRAFKDVPVLKNIELL